MSTPHQDSGSKVVLCVGDHVQVWSCTNGAWVTGQVDNVIDGQRVHVTYACGLSALGSELRVSSPWLRVATRPVTLRPSRLFSGHIPIVTEPSDTSVVDPPPSRGWQLDPTGGTDGSCHPSSGFCSECTMQLRDDVNRRIRALSVHYVTTAVLDEVLAEGLSRAACIYDMKALIRPNGNLPSCFHVEHVCGLIEGHLHLPNSLHNDDNLALLGIFMT